MTITPRGARLLSDDQRKCKQNHLPTSTHLTLTFSCSEHLPPEEARHFACATNYHFRKPRPKQTCRAG
ncbi:Hypp7462 [Branchiostoma lanceolatum]|uniref:Hypp7462 protein n=1 Tax=Branchiostoma lanceolatum TaxID=7740 RepID=A0A8K0EBS6_BRALA|nr:Hypp7462 [Branchiostoma lanceolatum]